MRESYRRPTTLQIPLLAFFASAFFCAAVSGRADVSQAGEISFDLSQRMMEINANGQVQQFHLDDNGYASWIENVTSGEKLVIDRDPFERPDQLTFRSGSKSAGQPFVVPLPDSENLQDLLAKCSIFGSGLNVQGDFLAFAIKAAAWDRFIDRLATGSSSAGPAAAAAFQTLKKSVGYAEGV